MSADLDPAGWLCAAIDMAGHDNFNGAPLKLVKLITGPGTTAEVTVLVRDTGAVWKFTCEITRPPA